MPDLSETIGNAAAKPKAAQVDGRSAQAHSLPELIEADRHLKSSDGVEQPHRGLRFTKLIPPGTA